MIEKEDPSKEKTKPAKEKTRSVSIAVVRKNWDLFCALAIKNGYTSTSDLLRHMVRDYLVKNGEL